MKYMSLTPTLSPTDKAWLALTIARNKARFGGFRMEVDGGDGGDGASADESGFPAGVPVHEMSDAQAAAYWRDKATKHEGRNKELLKITGGKHGDALKADMDELKGFRDQSRTDSEKAVEEARNLARSEVTQEMGVAAARVAFEFALGHDDETNDLSSLIDALDLSKVLTDDGHVDTAKVRAVIERIAPADKGAGNWDDADYGAGRRGDGTRKTGLDAGRDLYNSRHKKSETK